GWQHYFGGSADVVGKTMVLDGELNTVIGVLPRSFQFGPSQSGEIWQSMRVKGWKARRNAFWLNPIARLKTGIDLQQAQAGVSAAEGDFDSCCPRGTPRKDSSPDAYRKCSSRFNCRNGWNDSGDLAGSGDHPAHSAAGTCGSPFTAGVAGQSWSSRLFPVRFLC